MGVAPGERSSPARSAARRLVLDLARQFGELDPSRLRRCEHPECRPVFHDVTRSQMQRCHAGSSCGLREPNGAAGRAVASERSGFERLEQAVRCA